MKLDNVVFRQLARCDGIHQVGPLVHQINALFPVAREIVCSGNTLLRITGNVIDASFDYRRLIWMTFVQVRGERLAEVMNFPVLLKLQPGAKPIHAPTGSRVW